MIFAPTTLSVLILMDAASSLVVCMWEFAHRLQLRKISKREISLFSTLFAPFFASAERPRRRDEDTRKRLKKATYRASFTPGSLADPFTRNAPRSGE